MSYTSEIWIDIRGYEGYYQISNLGNVKSVLRTVKRGIQNITVNEKVLKHTNTTCYSRVALSKNKKSKFYCIHKLIAEHFIDNPKNLNQINHINGIKTDNRIENLEWCTSSQNTKHSYDNNLQKPKRGLLNGMCKISYDTAFYIKYKSKHLNSSELSKEFNISRSAVKAIRRNITWKHI